MDDTRLQTLLKMAIEAEDLERSTVRPELRLVGATARPRKWLLPVAGVMAAAAATLALVTIIVPAGSPTSPVGPLTGPVPTHQPSSEFDKPLQAPTPGDQEASVVLAFFETHDGRCSCVHIQDEDWNRDELAAKNRSELLDVAFRSKCSSPAPQLLVVAISGKRDSLPRTPEQAEALGAQLTEHAIVSRADLVNRAYQAVPGLPAGSMIVAESVGTRSSILEHAKYSMR